MSIKILNHLDYMTDYFALHQLSLLSNQTISCVHVVPLLGYPNTKISSDRISNFLMSLAKSLYCAVWKSTNFNLMDLRHPNFIDARDKEIRHLNDIVMKSKLSESGQEIGIQDIDKNQSTSIKTKIVNIKALQQEKIELERKFAALLDHQNVIIDRILKLTEANKNLENQLKEIEDTTRHTESEANNQITEKVKEISELKASLTKAQNQIIEYENEKKNLLSQKSPGNGELKRVRDALSRANTENRKLLKGLDELKSKENTCNQELKRLKARNEILRKNEKSSNDEIMKERDMLKEKLQKLSNETQAEHASLLSKIRYLEESNLKKSNEILKLSNYIKDIECHKDRMERYSKTLEKENYDLRTSTHHIKSLLHQAQESRKEAEDKVIESQKIVNSLKETLQHESSKSLEILENEKSKLTEINQSLLNDLNSKNDELRAVRSDLESIRGSKEKLKGKMEEMKNQIRSLLSNMCLSKKVEKPPKFYEEEQDTYVRIFVEKDISSVV
uniref:CSON003749 protein n=1 Tax=Culicoides sonorensis TaxID=179676 RepID=A0A336MM53_CULSO